jgi:hypothetical protein
MHGKMRGREMQDVYVYEMLIEMDGWRSKIEGEGELARHEV